MRWLSKLILSSRNVSQNVKLNFRYYF
jgi:hypothetical protein